jgi:hypothetical protein
MREFRRRFVKSIVLLCCATVLLYMCANLIGRVVLENREAWRLRAIAAEQARTSAYSRIVLTEKTRTQNAATWYRRSFARLGRLPAGSARSVAIAASQRSGIDSATMAAAGQLCEEINSARMQDALSSTKCDWELTLLNNGDRLDGDQSWQLGNCLVLRGHIDVRDRDYTSASMMYFEALSFASDLGQADYSTNLVGMAVAKAALDGLAILAAVRHDIRFLETTQGMLSRFETRLPSIDSGIRLARLRTATNLRLDAKLLETTDPWALRHVVPFRLTEAWQLSLQRDLFNVLLELSETRDMARREMLAKRIDDTVAVSANKTIRDGIPDDCISAIKSEEYLHHVYVATQASVELEEQRAYNGVFPATAAQLTVSLINEGLRYEVLEGGREYRVVMGEGDGLKTIVASRASKVSDVIVR